jgi:glycosyltransferase involved in cell wall biosynthesis
MAAAYELRLLRLLGEDQLGLVPRLTETLETHGFTREAEVVHALYADPCAAPERAQGLLKDGFDRLRCYNDKPWAVIDDRRTGAARVAVIVSLYNAADKLWFFLTALSQQTLIRQDQVEIILVDSGSPTNERAVFEAFHRGHPLSVIYARSSTRETIQAAWNRGIKLARAPYLVFLGVDETLYPETLEVLAEELDDHPNADWVMANSLVTAVDRNGLPNNDIMPYDRSGGTKDHVYLETCYVSWVGGMYRRSIHDRYGYYDETFRGAGDTEFKNRILPYINVRFVDRMLGLYLNYPDGQTTASPMAEIEDSRAWYLHRTAGGVRYAFENRPVQDAEALLRLALAYRKSYCRHASTDVEYAVLLTDYILSRDPHSPLANGAAPGLKQLLSHLRRLEFAWKPPSRLDAIAILIRAWRSARRWQDSHGPMLAVLGGEQPRYKILNDNRYEQHSWLWKSI